MDRFRWNDWNLEHVTKHGVGAEEAELVVREARSPYPQRVGEEKWTVRGRGRGGRFIQIVYLIDDDGATAYIIHARPLTDREKRRLRRRRGQA